MDVQTRIALCRLLEKMHRQEDYCKKIGLADRSLLDPQGKAPSLFETIRPIQGNR
ncbi:MAG: hypothetical protein Q4F79_10215 [Eubacteriales bacterium]|nr:hypothetical protein [Eubacteriales bacterium]